MNHIIALRCGNLRLRVDRADLPLDDLCGFASRRSRKRGFVFVSKVLGKHYPVRPATMANVHDRLADKLGALPGPVVFIGFAETATALGHGIFTSWSRQFDRHDAMYQHSTRYRLRQPLALNFDEAHSHAAEHLLYRPMEPAHAVLFRSAPTLVLIDDEMSTGRTAVNLARAYRSENRAVRSVHLVCLTDWLGIERRAEIAGEIGLPTIFHSLLEGEYALEETADFDPGPIPNAVGPGDCKDEYLPHNHGRLGVSPATAYDWERLIQQTDFRAEDRLLILGTGEFTYPPFLLARRLESLGLDVHFQSTTRSPLLIDRDITSMLEFPDNYHDRIANYVYNVCDRRYDRILIGYETISLPADHRLAETIGGIRIFF
jgi:hypothetical protein